MTIIDWVYFFCFIGVGVAVLLYAILSYRYDNKIKTVAIDGQVFEDVKCELNEFCNEVTIIYSETGRRVTLVYEEFEILKD